PTHSRQARERALESPATSISPPPRPVTSTMNNRPALVTPRRALGALFVAAASLFAVPGAAVGTRSFTLASNDDFKGGDLTGVSIDSTGTVRAGLNLGSMPIPEASLGASALVVGDAVLVGTGTDGKIFRVSGGRHELLATTGAWTISSMVVGWNGDVFAGSVP